MAYEGDILASGVVEFDFNTNDSTGAPITLAGTPAISVYRGSSTTESTSGVTLTVDHDGRTGRHHVKVDTSADGTFYAAGNDFQVAITAGTVSGISVVGVRVASFSIENRTQKADVRKWNGTTVATPNIAGIPKVDVVDVNGVAAAPYDATAQAGSTTTITLASSASSVNSAYVGWRVWTVGGTGANQWNVITAYNGTTKVATLKNTWTAPDSTTQYSLDPPAPAALADGFAHGGATATFAFASGVIAATTGFGLEITSGDSAAVKLQGGGDGAGLFLVGAGAGNGLTVVSTGTGNGIGVTAGVGSGISFTTGTGFALTGGDIDANLVRKVLGGGAGTITGDGVRAASVTGAVGSVASGGITAASFASGAVDATAFAQGAADKVWLTTVRTITGGTITAYTGDTPQTGDAYAVVADTTFGNAKLVRATTPANTLDVSSTGEAGLDFANIKQASSPTTLTNITVPTVTAVTNTVGANVLTWLGTTPLVLVSQKVQAAASIANYLATGTVASTTGTTTTLDAGAVNTASYYANSRLVLTAGTGAGQERVITAYASGRIATHAAWTTNPDATTTYEIRDASSTATASVDAQSVRNAMRLAATGGAAAVGSIDALIANSSVVVLPLQATSVNPGPTLNNIRNLYQYSAPSFQWTILDATGAAVSLSGKSLQLKVYTDDGTTRTVRYTYTTAGGTVTISGTGNNVVAVTFSATHTATVYPNLRYELQNTTDKLVLAAGSIDMVPAMDMT